NRLRPAGNEAALPLLAIALILYGTADRSTQGGCVRCAPDGHGVREDGLATVDRIGDVLLARSPWPLLSVVVGHLGGTLTTSHDAPRYLFLMRHAQHDEGHLTEEASAHIRSLAMRFSEWVQAEWRDQSKRTIRLWFTSTSTEVQETADVLTRDVLA